MKTFCVFTLFCFATFLGCEISREILLDPKPNGGPKDRELIGILVFPTGKGDRDVAAIEFRRLDQTALLVLVDPAYVTGNSTVVTPINFDADPVSQFFKGEFIANGISAVASLAPLQNEVNLQDIGVFIISSTAPRRVFRLTVKLEEETGLVKVKWSLQLLFLLG